MKLNNAKVLEILRKKNDGLSSYRVRKGVGVSERRVNQLWRDYSLTGLVPVLRRPGRPSLPVTEKEVDMVRKAHAIYGMSAILLERLIEQDSNIHIPHNRIHKILVEQGLAVQKEFMPRKKEWIRYERRHSLTAVHVDWHQRPNDGIWVFGVEDDASRFMLSLLECNSPTTQNSIRGLQEALQYGQIKECISDHGSQFTVNREGRSEFKTFLDQNKIKQILARIKHPQTNGKIERFFATYEQHRDRFPTVDKLKNWYNEIKPHMSLDFDRLETPKQAFHRKMKP